MTGELKRAGELANESTLAFERLTGYDEGNVEWRRASVKPQIASGLMLAASGRPDEALKIANQCISMLRSLIVGGTTDYNVQYHLAEAYALAAWSHEENDDVPAALEAIDRALESLRIIQAANRLNDERIGKLASLYLARSGLLAGQDDSEGAQQSLQQAETLLRPVAPSSRSPFLLDPWIRLLMLSGHLGEAQNLIDTLSAGRYVPLRPWPVSPGS